MIISAAKLQDRRAIRLCDCWDERRGSVGFPARRDFDPLDLGFALGNIVLVDVSYEPLRFRFKLVGSNVARHLNHEPTGCYLDECPITEFRDTMLSTYNDALARRAPTAVRRELTVGRRKLRYECVLLPLSEDGETINMFMTGLFFHDRGGLAGTRSLSAFAPAPERLAPLA